jgi:hypothetical protein
MSETLIVVSVILLVAWLIDCGWGIRRTSSRCPQPNPKASNSLSKRVHDERTPPSKTRPQTLRKDWLRLGRRLK